MDTLQSFLDLPERRLELFPDLRGDERLRVKRLVKSEDFLLFLQRVWVPRLNALTAHTVRPANTREQDLLLKGQRHALHQLLEECCRLAELPGVFAQETQLASLRRTPPASPVGDAPAGETDDTTEELPYAPRRPAYPA